MTSPNLLQLNHQGIKTSLIEYLKKQDTFKDYNFEGSGLNILLDVLAYNTQHNAYLSAMVANENNISSAILRSNVVQHAKTLGYTPKSITSSRAIIKVSISNKNEAKTNLLVPRGTIFTSSFNGKTWNWVTLEDYVLKQNALGVFEGEIEIVQGQIVAYRFNVSAWDERFVLPSPAIDTSTLKVAIYENATSNNVTVFNKITSIQTLTSDSEVYYIQEADGGLFEIRFGDGILGKKVEAGNMIYVEGVETNGEAGNLHTQFSLVGTFEGYDNNEIHVECQVAGNSGASMEETESIRLNAVRMFQSQNRAITKQDFEIITTDVYPNSLSVSVWGGEELEPPVFGKVFVSIVPKHKNILTSNVRDRIANAIKSRCSTGIDVEIINPNFIYLNLSVTALLDNNRIQSSSAIGSQIKDIIISYFNSNFGVFQNNYYESRLLSVINNTSKHIISSKVEVELHIETLLDSNTEVLHFNNEIQFNSLRFDKDNFQAKDGVLYEDNVRIGIVEYNTGTITFDKPFNKQVKFYAKPAIDDVYCGVGGVLLFNENSLSIDIEKV